MSVEKQDNPVKMGSIQRHDLLLGIGLLFQAHTHVCESNDRPNPQP